MPILTGVALLAIGPSLASGAPPVPQWNAPVTISTPGKPAQSSVIATNARGDLLLTWVEGRRFSKRGSKLRAAFGRVGGPLQDLGTIARVRGSKFSLPCARAAINDAGQAIVAWSGPDRKQSTRQALYAARLAPGKPGVAIERVAPAGHPDCGSVAISPGGRIVFAWSYTRQHGYIEGPPPGDIFEHAVTGTFASGFGDLQRLQFGTKARRRFILTTPSFDAAGLPQLLFTTHVDEPFSTAQAPYACPATVGVVNSNAAGTFGVPRTTAVPRLPGGVDCVAGSGNLFVLMRGYRHYPKPISFSTTDLVGSRYTPEHPLNPPAPVAEGGFASDAFASAEPDGRALVAWQQGGNAGQTGTWAAVRTAGGGFGPPARIVASDVELYVDDVGFTGPDSAIVLLNLERYSTSNQVRSISVGADGSTGAPIDLTPPNCPESGSPDLQIFQRQMTSVWDCYSINRGRDRVEYRTGSLP